MNEIETLLHQIDNQIALNNGKNILYLSEDFSSWFAVETVKLFGEIEKLDYTEEEFLIDYMTGKALKEFYRVNQYYSFNEFHQLALQNIYSELLESIKMMNGVFNKNTLEDISKKHSIRLTTWLIGSNSFAWKIYPNDKEYIEPVACYEYSPEIQLEILKIDYLRLKEPVLDIGCGSQGLLVKYLRKKGIDAYGFDRFPEDLPFLQTADWLSFDFENERWGTIISNQGYSNHFRHHHLRDDGNFLGYAKKYVEILNSLKVGGAFHYAPGLPFIESYLDRSKFNISVFELDIHQFNSIKISKLK
jgi:hypothetical protein